ncbi:MAG: helix-turn-helix transcriptional regulator [Syntrophaceae bacterium]|nr:helix-turn-helix transcriptional regulator [Syntrophaceae bacterium]
MASKNIDFTQRLKKAIKNSGLKNREFAEKAGIGYTTLMNYLVPKGLGRVPEWDQLVKISNALGESIDWLIKGIQPDTIPQAVEESVTQWSDEVQTACRQVKGILLSNHPIVKPMLLLNLAAYHHYVQTDKPHRKNDKLRDEEIRKLRGRLEFLEEWHKAGGDTGTDVATSSSTGKSTT